MLFCIIAICHIMYANSKSELRRLSKNIFFEEDCVVVF